MTAIKKDKMISVITFLLFSVFPTAPFYWNIVSETTSNDSVKSFLWGNLISAISISILIFYLLWSNYLLKRRLHRVKLVLAGIHILDNMRFWIIKNRLKNKNIEIEGLMDKSRTQDEEKELRKRIKEEYPKITDDEINILMDGFYRGKDKYRNL